MKTGHEQPKEWSICPVGNHPYGFVKARVSYFENGVRKETCLSCGYPQKKNED